MIDHSDPPRLKESGDDALREALRAARADLPSAAHLASISTALHGALGIPTTLPPPVLEGTGATAAIFGAGKVVAVVLAVAVGTGGVMSMRASHEPSPRRARVVASATTASETPAPSSLPLLEIVPATAPPPTLALREVPTAETSGAPSADVPEPTTDASGAVLPSGGMPTVPSEVMLLADARDALTSAPSRSLRMLDMHRRTYPRGALAQERDVMIIEALERLGHHGVAKARAERFLASHSGSVHTARVRALLEQAERADATRPSPTPGH